MQSFHPDFEIITMNAEIGSYQEDQDPERHFPDGAAATPAPETSSSEADG
jgi:hypothetical protein